MQGLICVEFDENVRVESSGEKYLSQRRENEISN